MKLLIDTSAIIDYINGDEKILHIMDGADDVRTSSLCAYETLIGASGNKVAERFMADLSPFPFTFRDSRRAADIYRLISKKGKTVNVVDILIYAQAIERGLSILTKDNDFSLINNVVKGNLDVVKP